MLPPTESLFDVYDNPSVGFVTRLRCHVLLYSVGMELSQILFQTEYTDKQYSSCSFPIAR